MVPDETVATIDWLLRERLGLRGIWACVASPVAPRHR